MIAGDASARPLPPEPPAPLQSAGRLPYSPAHGDQPHTRSRVNCKSYSADERQSDASPPISPNCPSWSGDRKYRQQLRSMALTKSEAERINQLIVQLYGDRVRLHLDSEG